MANLADIWNEPRRRNLAVLALIAVLMSLFAALALWHQSALLAPKYTPQPYFPGLAAKSPEVARIHIVSAAHGSFDVAAKPGKGWVLPGMHDYPANFSQVRKTIVGMAALETIAPKTARPDWLASLNLGSPKSGQGIEIDLLDGKGNALAAMIAGKTKPAGEPGVSALFVRAPDSNQSWLVRSVFTPEADPAAWLSKDVVSLSRDAIAEAILRPAKGPAYTVSRPSPAQTDFSLTGLPKGRELAYPTAPSGPAASLVDFSFDKIVPASEINFTGAPELETKTFSGLTVTARIAASGGDSWVMLSAAADPAKKAAMAEAAKINKAAAGWAFRIPAYKAAQFTTPLENLLKPAGGKKGR